MNPLNLIKELYNLYSDKEETPWITEIIDNGLGEDLDIEARPADPYVDL